MVYVAAPIGEFAAFRVDIERNYLRMLDRFGELGERVRCGQRAERIRTTPDLPNHLRVPHGSGWALVGDAGLLMDPITAQGIGNAFVDAERLSTAVLAGMGGSVPLAAALEHYRRRRDAERLPMFEFTLALAALQADKRMQLVLDSLSGRQEEIDRFLGVFAGIVPMRQYLTIWNLLRLVGTRGWYRVSTAAKSPRPDGLLAR